MHFSFIFGRKPRFPVVIILGGPNGRRAAITSGFTKEIQGSLQLAFDLARRNQQDRARKQEGRQLKKEVLPRVKTDLVKAYYCTDHTKILLRAGIKSSNYRGEPITK